MEKPLFVCSASRVTGAGEIPSAHRPSRANRVHRSRRREGCHTVRMTKTDSPEILASKEATIRLGGFSLILGALAFMGVFSYLAARFNYPQVLDGRASEVLPALLATGELGR